MQGANASMLDCWSVNIGSSLPDIQAHHQLPPYQWLPPQYNIMDSPEKAAHTGTEPIPAVKRRLELLHQTKMEPQQYEA